MGSQSRRSGLRTEVAELADKIAADLFLTGDGQTADRLALVSDRLGHLGGWSLAGATDRIRRILEAEAKDRRGRDV